MLKKYESPDLFVINFQTSDSFCATGASGNGDVVVTPSIPLGTLPKVDTY